MTKILIGSDPEVFLLEDGKHYNAYDSLGKMLKGTKKRPEATPYGAIQIDGTAVEFNTIPADNPEDFSSVIDLALADIRKRWPGPSFVLSERSHQYYGLDRIHMMPLAAVRLGCDPDFNAWLGAPNPVMDQYHPERYAGGHVHIGWTEGVDSDNDRDHFRLCCQLAKQLDFLLIPWSVRVRKYRQEQRSQHIPPGSFRPKPYGIEYRALSNCWIFDANDRQHVFRAAVAGYKSLMAGQVFDYDADPRQALLHSEENCQRAEEVINAFA